MTQQNIIQQTEAYVRDIMEGDSSGHDWWHIQSVLQNARLICKNSTETVDVFTVEMAVLLHDIGDYKFHNGDETKAESMTRDWLNNFNISPEIVNEICFIVANMSYKGGVKDSSMRSLEGKIVQDADRLDAIGAIGIARVFAYGGNKGQAIYNPEEKDIQHFDSVEAYRKHRGTSINHFYEKLLKLEHLMNTSVGKKIARERTAFMEQYLNQFYKEWDAK